MTMEKNDGYLSERILQLTLEVVYLLTGENYVAFKLAKGMVPPSLMNIKSRVIQHSCISLIPENKKKKVQEVTNKIIGLLTEEAEQEYIDRHQDVCKTEEEPSLTLSGTCISCKEDVSKKMFPNKCSDPPLSSVSTQNKHSSTQVNSSIVYEVKVENEEDAYEGGDDWCAEEESSQDSSTDEQPRTNKPERPVILTLIKKEKDDLKTDDSEVMPDIIDVCDDSKAMSKIPNAIEGSKVKLNDPNVDGSEVTPNIQNVFDSLKVPPSIPNVSLECYSDDLLSDPSPGNASVAKPPHPVKRRRSRKLAETFMCSLCSKLFNKKTKFIEHYRTHSGEKPYSCPICGKRFARKHSLIEHQKSHTGENQFSCAECGKQFARKQSLIEHQRAHTGDKLFPCPECGKVFTRRPNLIKHQRTHPGENSYACAECGKCFSDKSCFISHQKFHAGDNPYPCPDCGKCFKREKEMRAHLKSHKGDWPYSCSECGKKFRDKAYFVAHLTLHSGDKPHACEECGKSFAFKSSFQRHQRMHARKRFQWNEPIDYDDDLAPEIEDESVPSL